MKSLQTLIHDIETERKRNEINLNNIFRTQEKINNDEKPNNLQHKIKSLYTTGMSDAIKEENLIRKALSKIQEIRTIRNDRRIHARNAGNKETIRR